MKGMIKVTEDGINNGKCEYLLYEKNKTKMKDEQGRGMARKENKGSGSRESEEKIIKWYNMGEYVLTL